MSPRERIERAVHRVGAPVRTPLALRRHLRGGGTARLNLGCGGALPAGWLNTDRHPAQGAAHLDVTRRFPLPGGRFGHVLCEHVIEHVTLEQGRAMLRECARVLRPGGRVRVSTPDLALVAALACDGDDPTAARYRDWAAQAFCAGSVGTPSALVVNHAFRGWGHRFLYDEETLARALRDAGFTDIRRHPYRHSADVAFQGIEGQGIDPVGHEMRGFETLALEATRSY
ncbi:MAG TPA: methyltransferase domain-containing protein [Solirubrobacteraceae bacterium]|nr:methyltransferase domain-containing protein [Solirubrobacteraceae bacterium]